MQIEIPLNFSSWQFWSVIYGIGFVVSFIIFSFDERRTSIEAKKIGKNYVPQITYITGFSLLWPIPLALISLRSSGRLTLTGLMAIEDIVRWITKPYVSWLRAEDVPIDGCVESKPEDS